MGERHRLRATLIALGTLECQDNGYVKYHTVPKKPAVETRTLVATADKARGFHADIVVLHREPKQTAEDQWDLCVFKECLAHSILKILKVSE